MLLITLGPIYHLVHKILLCLTPDSLYYCINTSRTQIETYGTKYKLICNLITPLAFMSVKNFDRKTKERHNMGESVVDGRLTLKSPN